MNHVIKSLIAFIIPAIFVVSGCSKDDDATPAKNDANQFMYSDAFGAMVAVKTVTYTEVMGNLIPTELNTATAVFVSEAGSSSFTDAGTVKLNSKTLTRNSNNSYVYDNLLEPLTFNEVRWEVGGKGNVPAVTKTVGRAVPSFNGYGNLPESITRADGFSLALGTQVSQADSTLVSIIGGGKSVMKTVAGNAANVAFSASDLSGLSSGNGMIQVTPYNISTETVSGKKFYFINQASYTRSNVSIK